METGKKITLSTLKSFIKKNEGKLFINLLSSFDGMIDGVAPCKGGFCPAEHDETKSVNSSYYSATLGYKNIWLVGGSRDYLKAYDSNEYTGIDVSNSCGHFIVAIKKVKTYTDAEVVNWMNEQENNFKRLAQGFGADAIQSKLKLEALSKLTQCEKISIARLNLETIQLEGKYLDQLPH